MTLTSKSGILDVERSKNVFERTVCVKKLQNPQNLFRLPALLLVWTLLCACALPGAAAKEDGSLHIKLGIATGLREAPANQLSFQAQSSSAAGADRKSVV